MLDLQEHREVTEAQIPNELPGVGVDRAGRSADMTNGPETAVGFHDCGRGSRRFNCIDVRDFHSTPGEKTCYTGSGHRAPPFEAKQRSSTNVCLTPGEPVSSSFHAIKLNNFLGGEPEKKLSRVSALHRGAVVLGKSRQKRQSQEYATHRWNL
jgi:hypothetical protein